VADAERPAGTVAEVLQLGYSGGLRRRSMANPVLAATMPTRPR